MVIEQHGKLRMPLFTPQPIALQQRHTDSAFPLVLTPAHEEINFDEIAQQREALMALLALHGAIVFRGCGVSGDQRFDRFVASFGLENFPYDESLSNAVRRNRTPRDFHRQRGAVRRGDFSASRDGADTAFPSLFIFLL